LRLKSSEECGVIALATVIRDPALRLDIVPFVSHEATKKKKEKRGSAQLHLVVFASKYLRDRLGLRTTIAKRTVPLLPIPKTNAV
jgi:hypothetical protein